MRRCIIGFILACGILSMTFSSEAQQPSKVYRLAFLWANTSLPPAAPPPPGTLGALLNAFLQRLQELGWIEGQNLAIEHRFAEGQFERLPALAADLVGRKVDVIVATSGIAARAATQATETIPIVFTAAADALAMGLVASLAQPGGNVTGLTWLSTELSGKRLELLKAALQASRVSRSSGVPASPGNRISPTPPSGKKPKRRPARWACTCTPWRCKDLTTSRAPGKRPPTRTTRRCCSWTVLP